MSEIKKYSRRIRKIIEKNWEQIKYLFESDKFEDKKNKYLKALETGNTHSEALIFAYSKSTKRKNLQEQKERMYVLGNYLYRIKDMEFLCEICNDEYYNDYGYNKITDYFYNKENDKIIKIEYDNYIKFDKDTTYYWNRLLNQKDEDKMINDLINDGQKDLAIKLYERFIKKKEIKELSSPENNETSN